jgi:hypothetical protein
MDGPPAAAVVRHSWAEIENEYIRITYDGTGKSVDKMARLLQLGRQQVKSHIQFLGLANHTTHAHWDPKDDEIVRELVGKLSYNRIAKRLRPQRTATAVYIRITRLNLSRRSRDGWYTLTEVCGIFGIDHHKLHKYIDAGMLRAYYHHEHQPAKGGSSVYHIDEDAVANFLKRFPEELNGRNVDLIQIVQILMRNGHA